MLTTELIPKGASIRWTKDTSHVGRVIPFEELRNRIGDFVLYGYPDYQTGSIYKIVRIMDYLENANGLIKYVNGQPKRLYDCDAVKYADDGRFKRAEAMVSEMYCLNGRFKAVGECPGCFYEYND